MASRKNRNRKNRSRKNRKNRNNMYGGKQGGGACAVGGAPVNDALMANSGAQSLAQGRQFAEITRPYHGGGVSPPHPLIKGGRRMRGGVAPLSIFGTEGADVNRASAHLTGQDNALAEAQRFSTMNPDMPNAIGGQVMDAVNKGVAQVGAGRRRKSRKGRKSRKSRKGSRKSRKSRKMYYGGRRSSCGIMRGGAIYEGAPYSQGSSDMLLADDPSLAAQAAKMESPAWTGVERGTYL